MESEFQQKLQKQNQTVLKVDCGGIYWPTQAGDSFACQLKRQQQPNQQGLKTANQPPNLQTIKVRSGKSQSQSPTSDSIVVRVAPQGQVTWQEVWVVAAQPTKSATASPLVSPSQANPTLSAPAPPSSAASEGSPEMA